MATLPRCRCAACLDYEASDPQRTIPGNWLDAAQAEDVRAEASEARADRWRWEKKQRARRSARALAQILLGRRFRAMGIRYEPEFDNLEIERGDGTLPIHWACQYQGFSWALGAGDAVVVWLPGDDARYFECWNIVDVGRAVKRMVPR
jgi:hypothetical protein